MEKGIRQASKASSFVEASEDMRELAEIEISPTHLQRLSERIGEEWGELRDEDVEKFRQRRLERDYKEPPRGAAVVMLDGGRVQTRADDAGRGVSDPGWRESKVACCLTIDTKTHAVDPQPEPPAKFLEPTNAARLASEVKRRSRPAIERNDANRRASQASKKKQGKKSKKRKRARKCPRVRTVVATMENSETFGWQVAAEVHRRGLDRAQRKACVCDGQAYNWSIYEMHLLPAGFIAVLDFLHLLAYLHDAAYALGGADEARAWKTYKQWLRWAWSGKVGTLLSALREAVAALKAKGSTAAARQTNRGRNADLREQQPPEDELPGISLLGLAGQQRAGGIDDQANQPPHQGQRKILAGGRRGNDAPTPCCPIEPGRPLETILGAAPQTPPCRRRRPPPVADSRNSPNLMQRLTRAVSAVKITVCWPAAKGFRQA